MAKLVVVLGATGTQGGAVVNALLSNPAYSIRAISRHPESPSARILSAKGVHVVRGDLENRESLYKVFHDAYTVYGCTPFGDSTEEMQGRNIVDACKENNVPLLIWSSLPDATQASNGKYTGMSHYDRKAAVDRYIQQVGQPAVIINTGIFSDNLVNYGLVRPTSSGAVEIRFSCLRPNIAVPFTWIAGDLGRAVAAIIDNWENSKMRESLTKHVIPVCSFRASMGELAETVQRLAGKTTRYVPVEMQGDGDLAQMFRFQDEGLLYPDAIIPPPELIEMGVQFSSVEDFVKAVLVPTVS